MLVTDDYVCFRSFDKKQWDKCTSSSRDDYINTLVHSGYSKVGYILHATYDGHPINLPLVCRSKEDSATYYAITGSGSTFSKSSIYKININSKDCKLRQGDSVTTFGSTIQYNVYFD